MDSHHHSCFSLTLSPSLSYLYCLYSGRLPGQETLEWFTFGANLSCSRVHLCLAYDLCSREADTALLSAWLLCVSPSPV